MLKLIVDSKKFQKEMNNIMQYSTGFLEGVQKGKTQFYLSLAPKVSELAAQFVDANARMSPDLLHHVYEWQRTGSPEARLFDLDYKVSGIGITFTSSLKQSVSIKEGSNVPFYNKAKIMEEGIGVTIRPKKANVLRFEIDGTEIYTSNEVRVENPGGQTKGQFENVLNNFFGVYFRQSFLRSSGLLQYFKYPKAYKKNIASAKTGGRSLGQKTGYQWIANAGRGYLMTAAIHHPPTIINAYLADKIGPSFDSPGITYFFPTLPTQIDDLTNTFPQSNGIFGVYDRMFKMRRVQFPYIKCEQLLYYFYSVGDDAQKNMIITQQQVSDLLDNGDDSAKDLNEWAAANPGTWDTESKPCFFHNFKIYQLEETRDIVDFGTARTYAGNKIIIDYDWHPNT